MSDFNCLTCVHSPPLDENLQLINIKFPDGWKWGMICLQGHAVRLELDDIGTIKIIPNANCHAWESA